MVMETPSPQCVGREFVRQYYTLLHEAPMHLHRFYSNNSSFVHGGVEKPGEEQPPVMGQGEIHKKIMSLNFRDCHAKIRQVDSQATVGQAVVVQVTGELSNNGQPMRRFMQTFVLAPQSPKKYYVHNDIFRYQDEVFHDNDTDTENLEEAGEMGFLADSEPETVDTVVPEPVVQDTTVTSFYDQQPAPPPLSNGSAHMEERVDSPSAKSVEEVEKPQPPSEEVTPVVVDTFEPPPPKSPEPAPEPEQQEAPKAPSTFTWAALAGKNTPVPAVTNTVAPPVIKAQPPVKPEVKPEAPGPIPQPQRPQRPPRDRGGPERERGRESRGRGDDSDAEGTERRRAPRYPDSNQLFVGNLPHNISEKELKTFFEAYGKVVELRINTKGGGGKPNFGFVGFEEPGPVQLILSQKPIMFRGEHRLNVEEKKTRSDSGRPGSGTRSERGRGIGGPGGRGAGSAGRGGPRGGGMGGGGASRADSRAAGTGGGGSRGGFGAPRR